METTSKQVTGRRICGIAVAGLLGAGLMMPQAATGAIIVNQLDTDRTGDWNFRQDDPGNFANTWNEDGTHFAFAGDAATATSSATLPSAGNWSVEMWMPSRSATDNALLTVEQGGTSTQFRLNQSDGAERWSGNWLSLGVYDLDADEVSVTLDNDGASGDGDNVASMTGAVRFAQLDDGVTPFIISSVLGPVGSEGEFYTETGDNFLSRDAGIWDDASRISDDPDAEFVYHSMPLAHGLYELDFNWGGHSNRTEEAQMTVLDADGTEHSFTFDQTAEPADWVSVGTFTLDGSSEIRLTSEDSDWLEAGMIRATYIPEPASLALLGAGGLVLLSRRNRQRG